MSRRALMIVAASLLVLGTGAVAWAHETAQRAGAQAFVVNMNSDSVTPVSLASETAGHSIRVGRRPDAIAAAPDGKTVYVANSGSGTVTPITVATRSPGRPIRVGAEPVALTVAPDGRTVYVLDSPDSGPGSLVPIRTSTGKAGKPIKVPAWPVTVALTPDGHTALVITLGVDGDEATLSFISTRTDKVAKSIGLPGIPKSITLAPGGKYAYVAGSGRLIFPPRGSAWQGILTPVNLAHRTAGQRIILGHDPYMGNLAPDDVVFGPRATTAYAVYPGISAVVPVRTATGKPGRAIPVSGAPFRVPIDAVIPKGSGKLYVISSGRPDITAINLATLTPAAIHAGPGPDGPAGPPVSLIAASPDGRTIYAISSGQSSGHLTPINVRTSTPRKPIPVGADPIAVLIVP